MMYTDMVYYVLIIVRLRGSVKEKRELRVMMRCRNECFENKW